MIRLNQVAVVNSGPWTERRQFKLPQAKNNPKKDSILCVFSPRNNTEIGRSERFMKTHNEKLSEKKNAKAEGLL